MWMVGVLRGASFRPLPECPAFPAEHQAATWAREQLAFKRVRLQPGEGFLSWRRAA